MTCQKTCNPPIIKDGLSSLRPFLTTESPLKMTKSAFYFISNALFVFKVFELLFQLFGHAEKQLD